MTLFNWLTLTESGHVRQHDSTKIPKWKSGVSLPIYPLSR